MSICTILLLISYMICIHIDSYFKLNLMMHFYVKDLSDQILKEKESSPDMSQALDLLLSIAQDESTEEIQVSGDDNPHIQCLEKSWMRKI